eukprot:1149603-Pelagomonas_calceolata.AAC.4
MSVKMFGPNAALMPPALAVVRPHQNVQQHWAAQCLLSAMTISSYNENNATKRSNTFCCQQTARTDTNMFVLEAPCGRAGKMSHCWPQSIQAR